MIVGGYDLDMTYITDRILAMSFPAERMRSVYRNPLWQVKSVLDMRHLGYYKVCIKNHQSFCPVYEFTTFVSVVFISLAFHARTFFLFLNSCKQVHI